MGQAGALIGTFGTGFVLVPLMPVNTAVLIIGVALVLVGVALGLSSQLLSLAGVGGVALSVVVLGAWAGGLESPCEVETKYHCVTVVADPAHPDGYELMLDDLQHSYVDLNHPGRLVYPYTRWIAKAIDAVNPPTHPSTSSSSAAADSRCRVGSSRRGPARMPRCSRSTANWSTLTGSASGCGPRLRSRSR